MTPESYFKKNKKVYGIEEPQKFCGYATKVIEFDDLEKAKSWVADATTTYRWLGTKTDTKHI